MLVYIVAFCVSTIVFKFGDHVKDNKRKYVDIIAIFILCLLAGLRAKVVGTDTQGYLVPLVNRAISSTSIKSFMQYSWILDYTVKYVSQYEPTFTLLVYIISKCFKSIAVVQFTIELLCVLPVYIALRKKGVVPIWFGMLVYMLQYYNESYNSLRSSIAMSFVFLAITYWMIQKKRRCILFLAIAILFHYSALIGLIIIAVYEFLGKRNIFNNINIKHINMYSAIAAGILVLFSIGIVHNLIENTFLSRYAGYINGNIRFMPYQILYVLFPFIVLLANSRKLKISQQEWMFYVVMIAYVMIAGQITSVNIFGARVVLYFKIFSTYAYPLACKTGRNEKILTLAIIIYLITFWLIYYVLRGMGETVPYIMAH